MKKGRHRRYEEARELKRGPTIDVESLLDDESDESEIDRPGRSGWLNDEEVVKD